MENNEVFQNIDDDNTIKNNTFNSIEDKDSSLNTFVLGLPDWDLEPLFETIKRRDTE